MAYILDESGDPITDGLEPITDGVVTGEFLEGTTTVPAAPRQQTFYAAYRQQTFYARPR